MRAFLFENRRWLATGVLLTFGSSFGQTWFISLFAGGIRDAYGLSDGDWGGIYTLATLSSAALLLSRGGLADTMPLSRLVTLISGLFALACLGMALGQSVWVLGVSVFLLRFCGQGMFTHMGITAMGRWFVSTRGKAVSIANLGHPLGEVALPLGVVLCIGWIGWRATWGVTALVIMAIMLPLLLWLLARDRAPTGQVSFTGSPGLGARHWRRAEVLRHWLFWALIPMILTPGFIGTVVFFHQAHVAEVKGWSLISMAPAYPAYAGATVVMSLVAGWTADRFGPERLLPILLIPMGLAMFLIGPATTPAFWVVALGILGITQGMSGALWGAFLPAAYGTDNLGAVRATVTAVMVLSTAIGPGITGVLIDRGVTFPEQGVAMGLWCLGLSVAMVPVLLRYRREGRPG
ncbi:MFS transporter [Maritalea mobilis]|uniref:MFS transporter n=1 Tax=Maritalea mobilis TaxID=483324 RepID=UPI001C95D376|nr:MFS transporter [Maritalea mobilis]MBY6201745.1 MFS transporter [Maritalea mobilis]